MKPSGIDADSAKNLGKRTRSGPISPAKSPNVPRHMSQLAPSRPGSSASAWPYFIGTSDNRDEAGSRQNVERATITRYCAGGQSRRVSFSMRKLGDSPGRWPIESCAPQCEFNKQYRDRGHETPSRPASVAACAEAKSETPQQTLASLPEPEADYNVGRRETWSGNSQDIFSKRDNQTSGRHRQII